MKIAEYRLSTHALDRLEDREIKIDWIEKTILNPDMVKTVSDAEVHHFKLIEEFESRFLKVVLNPEKEVIVTFHFDRRLRRWK
ncbi:MAG: DUF4258 domain-containing protein [Deltaproteobacteria bacterium]|nr:DUF4258 domain-containing protein [Deltaproteobacteria bacterium]